MHRPFRYNSVMPSLVLKDRWIVVTGASSGLGRALALRLALREGAHLWICARRVDRLRALEKEIRAGSPSAVRVMEADLSRSADRRQLLEAVREDDRVSGLINNAGVTRYGPATEQDLEVYRRMLDVNLTAVMELSLEFLAVMRGREPGFLLNVTSQAAFVPTPYQAVYAAGKHAIQAFTDALRMERRDSPVFIGTFVPGGIRTEMIVDSGLDRRIPRDSWVNMTPDAAARHCIAGLKRRHPLTIPGVMNRLNHGLTRLFPREWVLRAAERLYRPPGPPGGGN